VRRAVARKEKERINREVTEGHRIHREEKEDPPSKTKGRARSEVQGITSSSVELWRGSACASRVAPFRREKHLTTRMRLRFAGRKTGPASLRYLLHAGNENGDS
jgi:hypothetical protein